MATLIQQANAYFASLNPMTKKVLQDQESLANSFGNRWEDFSFEEQEELIDRHMVDPETLKKYEHKQGSEQIPESFPKLKIESGEKIVVDFDKDCWTWRDEHSAPFSWETRSEHDLNVFDEEDEGVVEEDSNKEDSLPKRPKRNKKSHSPERQHSPLSLAFRPERSIWDSPFLAADRGLDSGYPSSQTSDHSKSSEEADEISNKFGVTLNLTAQHEKEEVTSVGTVGDEEMQLLDSHGNSSPLVTLRASTDETKKKSKHSKRPSSTDSSSSKASRSSKSSKKSSSKKESSGDKKKKSSRKSKGIEMEQSLMSSPSLSSSVSQDTAGGHVSPVFIEDAGESSTDGTSGFPSSTTATVEYPFELPEPITEEHTVLAMVEPSVMEMERGGTDTGFVNTGLDDSFGAAASEGVDDLLSGWSTNLLTTSQSDQSQANAESLQDNNESSVKTGFDFLDNW